MPSRPLVRNQKRPSVLGVFRAAIAAIFLVPTLFLGNFVQMLSLMVWPVSRAAFRKINRSVAAFWWGSAVLTARWLQRVKVITTGDKMPGDENSVIIVNHQSMSDIPVLFDVSYPTGRLGDLKWYVKDVLKWVPGVGWGMVFLDCIFIRRNWTEDRELIERTFRRIVKGKVPVWVVSFLEGTRITDAKVNKSHEYARHSGLPQLDHVLLPRIKGFVATAQGLGTHLDAVYDVTIHYDEGIPTLWQWAAGAVKCVHVHVERFPRNDIPNSPEELGRWVMERFSQKNRRLEAFRTGGNTGEALAEEEPSNKAIRIAHRRLYGNVKGSRWGTSMRVWPQASRRFPGGV